MFFFMIKPVFRPSFWSCTEGFNNLIPDWRRRAQLFQALFHHSWKESSLCLSVEMVSLGSSHSSVPRWTHTHSSNSISSWNHAVATGNQDYCPLEMREHMNHCLVSWRPTAPLVQLLWGDLCQSNTDTGKAFTSLLVCIKINSHFYCLFLTISVPFWHFSTSRNIMCSVWCVWNKVYDGIGSSQ